MEGKFKYQIIYSKSILMIRKIFQKNIYTYILKKKLS